MTMCTARPAVAGREPQRTRCVRRDVNFLSSGARQRRSSSTTAQQSHLRCVPQAFLPTCLTCRLSPLRVRPLCEVASEPLLGLSVLPAGAAISAGELAAASGRCLLPGPASPARAESPREVVHCPLLHCGRGTEASQRAVVGGRATAHDQGDACLLGIAEGSNSSVLFHGR
jgi:hypothetical protein